MKLISDRCTTYRWRFTASTLETLLQSKCRVSHPLNLFLLLQQQLPFLPGCFVGLLKSLDLSLETEYSRKIGYLVTVKIRAYPKAQLLLNVIMFSPICTCSCCSFSRRPLCFFLIGGILSSSPLSLSLFFWCSSQASSVLVFSLRAFWRRRSKELWCCSLTSSSFMY